MSASLVGSEMCIRDSLRSAGTVGLRRPPRRRCATPAVIVVLERDRVHRRSACLLYTSDAADDM
eukprot:165774-Alexandrium_andersonii.AAC.1